MASITFVVSEKIERQGGFSITLSQPLPPGAAQTGFSAFAPRPGQFSLNITDPAEAAQFVVGQQYTATFAPVATS